MTTPNLDYLVGREVTQVHVNGGYRLVLYRSSGEVHVQLSKFTIEFEDGTRADFDPSRSVDGFGRALGVLRARVDAASIEGDGHLELRISGVGTLTAEPGEDFEAWEIHGPGTRLVVCTPGGEITVWE